MKSKTYIAVLLVTLLFIEFCSSDLPPARDQVEIENIYTQWRNENGSKSINFVCDLETGQKIALCERIFGLSHYSDNVRVRINKAAFFMSAPSCENKSLTFFEVAAASSVKPAKQRMLPCYGRHDPVRTSFVEDDFFDAFFLSASPVGEYYYSVFVYTRKRTADSIIYVLYDFLQNVTLESLPSISIKPKDVTFELSLNRQIYSSENVAEIENTYLREIFNNRNKIPDPLVDLNDPMKVALCELVLSQDLYRIQLEMELNKMAFLSFTIKNEKRRLIFQSANPYNQFKIKQNMFPCFARHKIVQDNVLEDEFLKDIFISGGPRRNSLCVYIRDRSTESYRLFQFLENVNVQNLNPRIIKIREVYDESSIGANELISIILNEVKKGNVKALTFYTQTRIAMLYYRSACCT